MNTQAWIEALGWTLVHFLWQGAAVAALLWIFLQVVSSQRRPQLRYLAGCGSLLLLVALAVGTFARETAKARTQRVEIAATRTPSASLPAVAILQPITPAAFAPAPAIPVSISIPTESDPIVPPSLAWRSLANRLTPLLPGIVATWAIGVSLGFLRLCRCWNKVQRIRRSGQPLDESPWPASLRRLCDFLRLSRPVRLVVSAAVQVPMVIGWLKPVILLPCSIVTGLPREQVEAIVAHELAHIRRHDYLINVLQNVIETLFFFHPAVWWISGQIRREREHCCDDLASLACGGALPYVTALAALEEACGAEQRLTVAANGGSLLARVRRLLAATPAEGPGNGSYAATVAALALIVAVALPLAISKEPAAAPSVEEAPKPANASIPFGVKPSAEPWRFDKSGPGRHAPTRDLLSLWEVEFRQPKPMFAIKLNSKVQRKSPKGKPVGAAPSESREVRFEDTQLEHPDRETPSIPPEAFRRLIKHVDQYIARFPGEEAEKFRALLPQLKANQSRTLEETSALLDQLCNVATLPVHWQAVEEQFRAFEGGTLKAQAVSDSQEDAPIGSASPIDLRLPVKDGKTIISSGTFSMSVKHEVPKEPIVVAEPQKDLPFGPASPLGLRAAWVFRPMKDEYAMGEALTSRVIIHNAGTAPVEFIANARVQDARWSVVDANGTPVKLNETRWARAGEQRSRLAPGESLELPAFGLGIGPGDFDHVYEESAIAMKLPARAGDEFRCKWEVNLQAAWTVGDDDAAKPVPVKLETGEVKFRVADPPTDGPKPLGIATQGGFYVISPGVKLRITRLRIGPMIVTVNGVEKPPSAGDRNEIKEWNTADLEIAADRSKHISIRLPNGDNSYVIAWERGGTTLWVGEADWVRKVDISVAGRFPAAELLETINPLEREQVEKFLQNAGTGVPEQRWKWEDPGDFGGIPAHVKAALIQHRPKADSKAVAPEATYPLDAADPRLPWRASGQVKDSMGQPMPDVEIWVHTGFGSLKRTGFVKTDASGRYRVNFGPGVLMEEDSAQLQMANITAHRPGFFEKNLNRHGQGAAAMRDVSAESLKDYGVTVEQLTLPNSPRQVDFVMLPGVTLKGKLVGTGSFLKLPPQDYRAKGSEWTFVDREERNRTPLASWKVWLTGPKLPPGCSVLAFAETDKEGRFEFKDVPTGFEWQIQADTHHRNRDPRSPLFKVNASEDSVLEVELDEKQTGLKMLP
jgi:beta-lactamase regulating signal transducer with metallopeptidase domain